MGEGGFDLLAVAGVAGFLEIGEKALFVEEEAFAAGLGFYFFGGELRALLVSGSLFGQVLLRFDVFRLPTSGHGGAPYLQHTLVDGNLVNRGSGLERR